MRRRTRAVTAIIVVACLLSSGVAGVAVAAAQDDRNETDGTTEPTTVTDSSGEFTLNELRKQGTRPGGEIATPSERPFGEAGSFWIRTTPVRLGVGSDSVDGRTYLEEGDTVKRNHVYLGSFRGWNSEKLDAQIHVVGWQVGEETRTTQTGETYRVRTLENVTHQTVNATFAAGQRDEIKVSLPASYDNAQYVTMWVDGHEGKLQWVFRHQSSKAAQSVPISSVGDATIWATGWIFLPMLVTAAIALWIDRKIMVKAGTGPRVSGLEYALVAGGALFFAFVVFYAGTLDTLASSPYLIGVAGGLFVGAVAIAVFSDRGERALFLQLTANATMHPDGSGRWHLANRIHTLVDLPGGKKGIPKQGWMPFFARLWPFANAVPVMEFDPSEARKMTPPPKDHLDASEYHSSKWDALTTAFSGESSDDAFDVVYWIDPSASSVVEYESEGWEFSFPSLVSWPSSGNDAGHLQLGESRIPIPIVDWAAILGSAALLFVAFHVGAAAFASERWGYAAAGVAGLTLIARPTQGYGRVTLAPAHYGAVIHGFLKHLEEFTADADAEYWQSEYIESEAKRRASNRREAERETRDTFSELTDLLAPEDGRSVEQPPDSARRAPPAEGSADD